MGQVEFPNRRLPEFHPPAVIGARRQAEGFSLWFMTRFEVLERADAFERNAGRIKNAVDAGHSEPAIDDRGSNFPRSSRVAEKGTAPDGHVTKV